MAAPEVVRSIADAFGVSEAYVVGAIYLVAGLVFAWLSSLLIRRLALPLARKTATDFDEFIVGAIALPVSLTFVVLGAAAGAREVLAERTTPQFIDRIVFTLLLVLWAFALARVFAQGLLRTAKRLPGHARSRGALMLGRFMHVVVAIILLLSLLGIWGVSLTPLLASAGIAGIALALAAQDTLANLFAGVAVYADGLYEVGDYVVLDAGAESEVRGEVRDVGLRSTRILTRDDVLVIVPNSVIANGRVINETGQAPQVPHPRAHASRLRERPRGGRARAAWLLRPPARPRRARAARPRPRVPGQRHPRGPARVDPGPARPRPRRARPPQTRQARARRGGHPHPVPAARRSPVRGTALTGHNAPAARSQCSTAVARVPARRPTMQLPTRILLATALVAATFTFAAPSVAAEPCVGKVCAPEIVCGPPGCLPPWQLPCENLDCIAICGDCLPPICGLECCMDCVPTIPCADGSCIHVRDVSCDVIVSNTGNGAVCETGGNEYGAVICEYCVNPTVALRCHAGTKDALECRLYAPPLIALP